ncbi:MAG: RagB/SusD family nutrient uptake outer membrane protein [Pedobacter sp.]|nr:MAG: RagB/SusD family nutrient uptake outer membrane protein [Pedobacter sp.]
MSLFNPMKMKQNRSLLAVLLCLTFIIFSTGCKKLIETGSPKNQLSTDKVFLDSATANAVMVNVYARIDKSFQPVFSKYMGMYTDEYINATETEYMQSLVAPGNGFNQNAWTHLYFTIYQCNDILEQLPLAENLTAAFKQQMEAEARFLRAFAYFNLVNMYGDVPLLLTTDVELNRQAPRTSADQIYQTIIKDLNAAKQGLSTIPATVKERANPNACSALLSRVYLYLKQWELAEAEATSVINSGFYNLTDPIANIFKSGSKETILQLWTQNGFITDAPNFIPSSATTAPTYFLSPALYATFESNDLRKTSWIGISNVATANGTVVHRYPAKYKNRIANTTSPEYLVVLRLAEQYLIRAEARVMKNKLTGTGSAAEDLNKIRNRAGLGDTPAQTSETLLAAISKERRVELFTEWGDRFFDLKRAGQLNQLLSAKPNWKPFHRLWPVPQKELLLNPAMNPQNTGY